MTTITLNWKGPVTYIQFQDGSIETLYPDLSESGIYLWGIEYNSKVFINYVGQSTNVKIRLFNEFVKTQRNQNSLINIKKFQHTGIMDIDYIPEYDFKPEPFLVKDNLEKHIIYYAVMKAILVDNQLEESLLKVEGAIQGKLYLNGETRGYLTTKVSTWSLRDTIIINNIPTGINLFGLEHEITTQASNF